MAETSKAPTGSISEGMVFWCFILDSGSISFSPGFPMWGSLALRMIQMTRMTRLRLETTNVV